MKELATGINGSVFISYSRRDKPFVKKLNDALDQMGVNAWVDWEGIEVGSDWMQTITEAIRNTDAIVYVISPDSVKSKVCARELEIGLRLNKKLIPILRRQPDNRTKMHKQVSATNWVSMRKEDNFKDTLPKLVEAINTDLTWVQQHTQLLGQASEWEQKNKNISFLLGGTKLEEAERWMADASGKANRQILPLQAECIRESRAFAIRRQRSLLIGVTIAALVSLAAAAIALVFYGEANQQRERAEQNEFLAKSNEALAIKNRNDAELNAEKAKVLAEEASLARNIAEAQRSAALSQTVDLDTSTLLAIDSWRRNPSFEAEDILRRNISLLPIPVKQMSQDGAIWNIAWTPDNKYFVTGNNTLPTDVEAENEACVYSASNGEVLYCVSHAEDVNDAIFTKDGKYLITASADQTVRFWEAATGKPVEDLNLQLKGAVLDLDVSESVLAIAREDNFLTLYYLNKPDLKPVNIVQADRVRVVKFSPNGVFLAIGLQNGIVRFWQANDNFFYEGPVHTNSPYVVLAFSPDNNWLVSGGGDSLARLTKRDGTPGHQTKHQDWVEGVTFAPDSTWYVTVSDDNNVRVINTETGIEKHRMAHTNFVQEVTVSSDGQWIASTGYDHVVRVWDSASGTQVLEIPLETNGSAVSFNQDVTRIVVTDEDGNIGLWDVSKLKITSAYIEFAEFLHEARFVPSGEYLIVNSDDFNVWKIPTGQVDTIRDGTSGEIVQSMESLTYDTSISPNSLWAAVVEFDSEDAKKNQGTLINLDQKIRIPLVHVGEVTGVAFTQDSKQVATSGVDGLVWFWDVESGTKKFNLDAVESIYSLANSPSSSLTVVGLSNKIMAWNLSTKKLIAELEQQGDIGTLAFSQDGSMLATSSSEGILRLWSVTENSITQKGSEIEVKGSVQSLAFSPDNHWLAGGGSANFAYLWDTATQEEMTRIAHGNPVSSISFSPDGTQLLTVSRKFVRIWNLPSLLLVPKDELITAACSHLASNFSEEEWGFYFQGEEYYIHCPGLPVGQ